MKKYFILCILAVVIITLQTEVKLPVRSDTQQKLSLSLQKLIEELQFFRTPYESKTNLYKRIAVTEQYLQQVNDQVSQYDNVVIGQQNSVDGQKNIIVGSFNTIKGSNNYVFIEKYSGQANGDLLIGKWRIEIQKKKLILVNATNAISYINEQTNRKYMRYLTQNRAFTYGTSQSDNLITLIKENDNSFSNSFTYGSSNPYQYTQNTNYPYGSSIGTAQSGSVDLKNQIPAYQQPQSSTQQNQGTYSNSIYNSFSSFTSLNTNPQTQIPVGYQSTKNTDIIESTQNVGVYKSPSGNTPQSFVIPVSQPNTGYSNSNFNANSVVSSYSSNLRSQPQKNDLTQTNNFSSVYYNSATSTYTAPVISNIVQSQFFADSVPPPQYNSASRRYFN